MLQRDFFYLAYFFIIHLLWEQGGIYRHLSVVCTHTHTRNSQVSTHTHKIHLAPYMFVACVKVLPDIHL